MSCAKLTIDLDAVVANWRALDALSGATVETGAVVKANAYGLGVGPVARALAHAGVRRFFVGIAEEGAEVRAALGPGPEISVFGGHMRGDTDMIHDLSLTPIVNSLDQITRHLEALPGHAFGVQLDTGLNRLGLEAAEWAAVRDILIGQNPRLVMSHLACADEPDHAMNAQQLRTFREMTDGIDAPRSLAATGGIQLGPDYHFDITRTGIGIYGGLPFAAARPAVHLSLPVVQIRELAAGETVGYGNTWTAEAPCRIATLAAGYADGLLRAMGPRAVLYADGISCKIVGRVSMDLITVDVTHLKDEPQQLDILGEMQSVDMLAAAAGTIGYEILTSLGPRYERRYRGNGTG